MYNQHFNRKNIEAAVRVALANKDTTINVNGERSKVRYKVEYSWIGDSISLIAENKKNGRTYQQMLTYVDVSDLTKRQVAKNSSVELITNHFKEVINNYKAA